MPPGVRKHELEDGDSILKAAIVIPQNKVCCGEALAVVHDATSEIVLSKPCRRIRVVVDGSVSTAWSVWFSWGTDHTAHENGRVMVGVAAPLDIVLDEPEDHFYVRRIASTATTVNVGIMGVF